MFLHYVFDMWMKRNFPQAERYADDGVVHCRTKEEALYIKEKLAKRFEECKLELHPVKIRIVYCKDKDRTKKEELTEFDFLGYTFKAVYIKCKDVVMQNNFIASVSKTAAKGFRDKIKALEIHKRTGCKIDMIAELLNPMASIKVFVDAGRGLRNGSRLSGNESRSCLLIGAGCTRIVK